MPSNKKLLIIGVFGIAIVAAGGLFLTLKPSAAPSLESPFLGPTIRPLPSKEEQVSSYGAMNLVAGKNATSGILILAPLPFGTTTVEAKAITVEPYEFKIKDCGTLRIKPQDKDGYFVFWEGITEDIKTQAVLELIEELEIDKEIRYWDGDEDGKFGNVAKMIRFMRENGFTVRYFLEVSPNAFEPPRTSIKNCGKSI